MAAVEHAYGVKLDAMRRVRDRLVEELAQKQLEQDDFGQAKGIYFLLLSQCATLLDSIRILVEHAKANQALGLVRGIYEAELDALVLASDVDHNLKRFHLYHVWEKAAVVLRFATLAKLDQESDPEVAMAIQQVAAVAAEHGLVLTDEEESSLETLVRRFGASRLGAEFPRTWRPIMTESVLIETTAKQREGLFPDSQHPPWVDRLSEYRLSYGIMSAILHNSPDTLAKSVVIKDGAITGVEVAGTTKSLGQVFVMAGYHLGLARLVLGKLLELSDEHDADWDGDLAILLDQS